MKNTHLLLLLLLLYRLGVYVHTWETQRRHVLETFSTYKHLELKKMKRLITTQCEQEINVLNIEKEHFERQCSQFSEDIQLCTQQVQELEVQMKVLSVAGERDFCGRTHQRCLCAQEASLGQ